MSSNINILKWLFALVLIFGGFTIYKIFGVLAADLGDKDYVWLLKIISEFGLFTSVVISVGFFHHWIIATEERKETEKMFTTIIGNLQKENLGLESSIKVKKVYSLK